MPIAELEGQRYDFPEGTTTEEMVVVLAALPKEEEQAPTEDKQEPFAEEKIIRKDEGVRRNEEGSHVAYRDSLKFLAGGVGHLMTKEEKKLYPKGTPIPNDVVDAWFKTDMHEADTLLTDILEQKAVHVPDEVYDILLNMTFNLGGKGLNKFKKMWAAIEVGDWNTASDEMEDSKWAKQVGNRATRLINRMAAIPSNIPEEEIVEVIEQQNNLTPVKGGLFEDENGKLFLVDNQGNKKEV